MPYEKMRNELQQYYLNEADDLSVCFYKACTEELDALYDPSMSAYDMKVLQYQKIVERMDPKIFRYDPFFFETATMPACCDGSWLWNKSATKEDLKEPFLHAGGWTFLKNEHLFIDQDEALWKVREAQAGENLYLICGAYNDNMQHYNLNFRPVLEKGFSGIYEEAAEELKQAAPEEKEFLQAVMNAMQQIRLAALKFSEKARLLLQTEEEKEARENYRLIAETAAVIPWNKPRTLYEALTTCAFFRKITGTLEGIGPNTFGRLDMDLAPFYEADIAEGRLTKEGAYDLICRFLLSFDCCYDHDKRMVGYADHELENTYTIGGCDREGKPFCNDLTIMFLRASRVEEIIFPKIKCRFSANSPKEYLDEIDRAVLSGMSTVLYVNDDCAIPARLNAGRTIEEARDYIVTGCWGLHDNGFGKYDDGNYLNILKALEFTIYQKKEIEEKICIKFLPIDNAKDFEELYQTFLGNVFALIKERFRVSKLGGQICEKVAPVPIFSSTFGDCIKNRKDLTGGGDRYHDCTLEFFGFANVVDSLLAIREIVFERKLCSLKEYLDSVRSNWEGREDLRQAAIHCNGWGDGSEEAGAFSARFQDDLSSFCSQITGTYGGRVLVGHYGYTEIRFWGEQTLATPDGRHHGEYIVQGLTPSRLKKIPSVTDVIRHLSMMHRETLTGGSVINLILPGAKMDLDILENFLRGSADSALGSLQLNVLKKEDLLDAQKHPENYPNLIVRVCGFSARFTALSKEWQEEVLSRNFYEN